MVSAARALGAAGAIAATALLAGCAQAAMAGTRIQVGTAYVPQPGSASSTDAYVVIQNDGGADRLLGARTSVGGKVELRGPADGGTLMRTVPAIRIPGHQITRLTPDSYHLLIIGPGRMKSGHEITLTLDFARAGIIKIAAQVTDPQSGGSSYFLN
ncbi:MAG: copper chaperone PCu(A)C [Streptosporangiaceae bacterium]